MNLIFFLGHQVLPVFILNYDEPGRRQILYLCNLEAHHPQILKTFDIYFIPQKKYLLEKVLWDCHVGKYATFVRLKFWCGFNVSGWFISLATCRSLENQAETFFMSPRLFSATSITSAYFCNLKSEWLQFFRKRCSSTDSKMAESRCLNWSLNFKFLVANVPARQTSALDITWVGVSKYDKRYKVLLAKNFEMAKNYPPKFVQFSTIVWS